MRQFLLCTLFGILACGERERGRVDPGDPDNQYYVRAEIVRNDCDNGHDHDPAAIRLMDVVRRYEQDPTARRSYDLRYAGYGLHDEARLADISSDEEGEINQLIEWNSYPSGRPASETVTGRITDRALELYFAVANSFQTDFVEGQAIYRDCQQDTRITGQPRPITDPTHPDGRYLLRVYAYGDRGHVCSDADLTRKKLIGVIPWNVYAPAGGDYVQFVADNRSLWFSLPEVASIEAAEKAETTIWLRSRYGEILDLPGAVWGVFTPEDVQLEISYRDGDDRPECEFRYAVVGPGKHLPNRDDRQNEYGVRVIAAEDMFDDDGNIVREDRELPAIVDLVDQEDHVRLTEPKCVLTSLCSSDVSYAVKLHPDEVGRFSEHYESSDGSATLDLAGYLLPPFIVYSGTYRFCDPWDPAAPCLEYVYDVEGHGRYLPRDPHDQLIPAIETPVPRTSGALDRFPQRFVRTLASRKTAPDPIDRHAAFQR